VRFLEAGPVLPSALVNGRDDGQVIFFCGAGVSRARAKLPDFFGLADDVVARLRPSKDGAAHRLLQAAHRQERVAGVGGLIPTDRIFGLLEREFGVEAVRVAVAQALAPGPDPDLSAHQILLDLARTASGEVRLVTTNFDLLFEACDPSLEASAPPNLPDPAKTSRFGGIVHLHGCLTADYDGAQDDELVLSSADFGRAYLSEGWATTFIRRLLARYQLVFVGYAADDPPVQYLLEALNSQIGGKPRMYAFQGGSDEGAISLWRSKGVEGVVYDDSNDHSALWASLAAWAEQARDSEAWNSKVIDLAKRGPRACKDFERGQVAHFVSVSAGARKFLEASPPAEWLCVFDANCRYADPVPPSDEREAFDAFEVYGLDDDPPPPASELGAFRGSRAVPDTAWDAFRQNETDSEGAQADMFARVRGPGSVVQPRLSSRLHYLGHWIPKISHEGLTLWWAAGTGGLHPDLQFQIHNHIDPKTHSTAIRAAWSYLLLSWRSQRANADLEIFSFAEEVKALGWTRERVRQWAKLTEPKIKATRPWGDRRPPLGDFDGQVRRFVNFDVDYPTTNNLPAVDDALLSLSVVEHRRTLEIGVERELALSGIEVHGLPSIEPDDRPGDDSFARSYGIAGPFFKFLALIERLALADPESFRREVLSWTDEGIVFSRLRIWAAGRGEFSPSEAARLLAQLSRDMFWSHNHQRDLLIVLSRRWRAFSGRDRSKLEKRLLQGPPRWMEFETRRKYSERRSHHILSRLLWLSTNGVQFSFNFEELTSRYRSKIPGWKDEFAQSADESLGMRSGSVGVDKSTQGLENEPPANLLNRAGQLAGRDFHSFVDRRPLEGVALRWPTRLLRALILATKQEVYPLSAWQLLLQSQRPDTASARMGTLISRRLVGLPESVAAQLAHSVTDWMLAWAGSEKEIDHEAFFRLWALVAHALRSHPDAAHSSVSNRGSVDWATHALNSPTGRLAQVLLKDPARRPVRGTIPRSWLNRAEQLLELDGDAKRHVIVMFAYHVPWLFHWAPRWTEAHLLSVIDGGDVDDASAFWAGFFWAARHPSKNLYLRLKPSLLALVTDASNRSENVEQLAGILLAGWGSKSGKGERAVSNEEMHAALLAGGEAFRRQIIWILRRWSAEPEGEWSKNAVEFLASVWPMQLVVRSSSMSDNLVDLILGNPSRLSTLFQAARPALTHLSKNSLALFKLKDEDKFEQIDSHSALIDMLLITLPEDANEWPYGTESVVDRLSTMAAFAADRRLIELRRRVANR
jgi:hypothetical protein